MGFTTQELPEFRFQLFDLFPDCNGLFELLKGYVGKRVGLHGNPVTPDTGSSQADGNLRLSRWLRDIMNRDKGLSFFLSQRLYEWDDGRSTTLEIHGPRHACPGLLMNLRDTLQISSAADISLSSPEGGEGQGEEGRVYWIPLSLPSPHSCVVGRGNSPCCVAYPTVSSVMGLV